MKKAIGSVAVLTLMYALTVELAYAAEAGPPCSEPAPAIPLATKEPSRDFGEKLRAYLRKASAHLQVHGSTANDCLEELGEVLDGLDRREDLLNPSSGTVDVNDILPALNSVATVVESEHEKRKKVTEATKTDATKANEEIAARDSDALRAIVIQAREIADRISPRYGFYSGAANQLTPDGGWKSGLNVMYRSESPEFRIVGQPSRVFVNFEYFNRKGDKTNTDPEAATTMPGTGMGTGADAEAEPNEDPKFVSPFDAEGGIVNIQAGYSMFPSMLSRGFLGWGVRAGLESLPLDDDKATFSSLEPFYAAGLVTRSGYPDGAVGQFFLGVGKDKRWSAEYTGTDKDQYKRIILGGLLELVKFGNGASIATRIHASTPTSGKRNESEVRVSILLGFDITQLRSLASVP